MSYRYPATPTVRVVVEHVGADLRVRGWTRDEIKVSGDSPRVTNSEDGTVITIYTDEDCDISLPEGASLKIDIVDGDAKITEVRGALRLESVAGDLRLHDVGTLSIESVGSDLRVRQANGSVTITSVGGDATIYDVKGDAKIGDIGGDAYFREVSGSCVCDFVGGDLILQVAFDEANEYAVNAGGDIVCRCASGCDVRFQAHTDGDFQIDIDSAQRQISRNNDDYEVTLGKGSARVKLDANGDIRILADDDFDLDVNIDLEGVFDIDVEHIMEQTSRAAERARRQAERIREQVTREAERMAEDIRRQAERAAEDARREMGRGQKQKNKNGGGSWGWSWDDNKMKRGFAPMPPMPPMRPMAPMPPMPPMGARPADPKNDPVTNDERLAILRMIEAKQITVEEAERLLAALEGRA